MSATEEENWRRGFPLEEAWLELADHTWPEGQRKAQWKANIRTLQSDTLEETDRKLADADRSERGLKQELLYELLDGHLQAYGRDITERLDAPLIALPAGMFDQGLKDFEINWESSFILAHGRKVIEVRVAPLSEALDEEPRRIKPPKPKQVEAQSINGRPNIKNDFMKKLEEVVKQNPDFLMMGTREDQAREIRARLYGEPSRHRDEMPGCKTDTAKRWVGEFARKNS